MHPKEHQANLKDEIQFKVDHREALMAQLNQRSADVIDRYTQLLTANQLKTESPIVELVKSRDFLE